MRSTRASNRLGILSTPGNAMGFIYAAKRVSGAANTDRERIDKRYFWSKVIGLSYTRKLKLPSTKKFRIMLIVSHAARQTTNPTKT